MKDPAPLLRDAWLLTDWLLDRFGDAPDPLGKRIAARALDLIEAVTIALQGRPRPDQVETADETLAALRMLVRLAAERGALTDAQALHALDIARSMGRQIGGLLRSLGPV